MPTRLEDTVGMSPVGGDWNGREVRTGMDTIEKAKFSSLGYDNLKLPCG